MAPLAGGPTVADEFKASPAAQVSLANRLKQIQGSQTTQTSNDLHNNLPAWLQNAQPQLPVTDQSHPNNINSLSGVGQLGQAANNAVSDAFAYKQEAAARKMAAQNKALTEHQAAIMEQFSNMSNSDIGATAGAGLGGTRGEVIKDAKKLLGVDYVYGGGHGDKPGPSISGQAHGSATYGVDCSGLVRYAFARAGLGQWGGQADAATESMYGKAAPVKSLLPGDLVVRGGRGSAHHIAIYLGKGMIIEAQQTGTRVHIRSIGGGAGWTGIHLNY